MPSEDEDIEDISPHIRIRIDPRKKKEWLEYADENHHGNLTDLIKDAVDNTIEDKWVLANKHQAESDIDTSELEDGITEITDRLSVVEDKINDLSVQSTGGAETELSRDDLIQLANSCHDLLPRLQGEIQFPPLDQSLAIELDDLPREYERKATSSSVENPTDFVRAKATGRAEDVATALEEPVHKIRQALMYLEQSDTGMYVESTIDQGVQRWFVRDPNASPDFDFLEEQESDSAAELFDNNSRR